MIVRDPRAAGNPTPVAATATAADAARLMLSEDVDELPVVEGEEVVGVVTDRDLVAGVMARALDPGETRVADVCSPGG